MFGFFENGVKEIKRFFSPEGVGMNVSLFSPLLSYHSFLALLSLFFNRLDFLAVNQSTCVYFSVESLTHDFHKFSFI